MMSATVPVKRSNPVSASSGPKTGSEPGDEFRVDKEGFTLIEALVSLLILSVIFLGLQAAMMTAITLNTENLLHNEAVKLAQERMDRYRIMTDTPPNSETFNRQVRNFDVTYTIDNTDYNSGTNILNMRVLWEFQNETRTLEYSSHIG